jgi:hypothetical protein
LKVLFGPQPTSSRPSRTLRRARFASTTLTRSAIQVADISSAGVAHTLRL